MACRFDRLGQLDDSAARRLACFGCLGHLGLLGRLAARLSMASRLGRFGWAAALQLGSSADSVASQLGGS
eukprot:9020399-Karenia_brevis.AAC.1